MITLSCDKCEEPFEVEDAAAGGKATCPYCGDINRVPGSKPVTVAAAAPAAVTPVVAGAHSEPQSSERDVAIVRPAMFRAHPFKYALMFLVIVGGAGLAIWGFANAMPWYGYLGLAASGIALVWWVAWWVATTRWVKVIITTRRTIRHEGIIKRHTTEILHNHVRSVDIRQNVMQRLLNVGYIGIDSAGQDEIEIEIRDIPAPHKVKEVIDRHRRL